MSKLAHSHQPTMDAIDAQRALAELTFNEAFGLAVKNRRHRMGWTQQKLADRLGKNRTTIANIETGRQGMSFEDGLRLMQVVGLTADQLIKRRDYIHV